MKFVLLKREVVPRPGRGRGWVRSSFEFNDSSAQAEPINSAQAEPINLLSQSISQDR